MVSPFIVRGWPALVGQFRHAFRLELIRARICPELGEIMSMMMVITTNIGRHAAHEFYHIRTSALSQVGEKILARAPGSNHIDERIPEALEREYKGTHELERHGRVLGVEDGVHTVGA
jgi:hypothetical protein